MSNVIRCAWCGTDPLMVAYHDTEWGVPERDDQRLYEKLILDGAQAGLSWSTILKRREGYRQAFDRFDIQTVAQYDEHKVAELMQDSGIIRNRQKIVSAIKNAQAFIRVQAEFGSFEAYLWGFVEGKPIVNAWQAQHDLPAQTPLSVKISKDLQKRGFSFVGPTIIYAYMQALGIVNDHLVSCFRYEQLK